MKFTAVVKEEREVEVAAIELDIPAEEIEDSENNQGSPFPDKFKSRGVYTIRILAETGKVVEWPEGVVVDVHTKPRDSGSYRLLGPKGETVASIEQDYVPGCCDFDGESYGDYVVLKISGDGSVDGFSRSFTARRVRDAFFPVSV